MQRASSAPLLLLPLLLLLLLLLAALCRWARRPRVRSLGDALVQQSDEEAMREDEDAALLALAQSMQESARAQHGSRHASKG